MIELFFTFIVQCTYQYNIFGIIRLYDLFLLIFFIYVLIFRRFKIKANKTILSIIIIRVLYILMILYLKDTLDLDHIMSLGYFIEFIVIYFLIENMNLNFDKLWKCGKRLALIDCTLAVIQSIAFSGAIRGYGWAGSSFAIFYLPFVSYAILKKKTKTVDFIFISIYIISLILSQQRTLILCFLLNIVILFLFSFDFNKRVKIVRYLLYLSVIVLILFMFLPDSFKRIIIIKVAQIFETTVSSNNTIGTRYRLWEVALDIFKKSPFFGMGSGSFVRLSLDNYNYASYLGDSAGLSTHNQFLEFLCELGIIGFLITIILVIYIVCWSLKNTRKYGSIKEPMFISIFSSFLTATIYDFFSQSIFFPWWCYLLLLLIIYNNKIKTQKHKNLKLNVGENNGNKNNTKRCNLELLKL